MAQAIPDRSLVTEISRGFLDCLYSTEVGNSNSNHMNGKDHWGGNGPALLVHTGKYNPPPSFPPQLLVNRTTVALSCTLMWKSSVIEAQTGTEELLFPNKLWHFDSVSYSFSFQLQPVLHAYVCCTCPSFQTAFLSFSTQTTEKHAVLPSSASWDVLLSSSVESPLFSRLTNSSLGKQQHVKW